MRKFRTKNRNKKTITKFSVIVFFIIFIISFIMFINYGRRYSDDVVFIAKDKIEKITYQFFSDLITDEVITNAKTDKLIIINKNNKDEIISVDYNMEDTYALLTEVSKILKDGLNDFENGKLNVNIYDVYLKSNNYGIYLNFPVFSGTDNIFITNLGPKIPIYFHFTGSLLTNIKTKVKEYGLNNALLEIYITVYINENILTPVTNKSFKTNYDILIAAKVVNGKVPEFYGNGFMSSSNLVNTSIEN